MPNQRVARLREAIARTEAQAILITNRHNVRYLTGFSGTSGAAIISTDKAALSPISATPNRRRSRRKASIS